jgi:hypothetical protein
MKFLILPVLFFSMIASGGTTYYPNDGKNPPGSFTEKSNDVMKTKSNDVIERQEAETTKTETGATERPVLDNNPNDQTYKIEPLPNPKPSKKTTKPQTNLQ